MDNDQEHNIFIDVPSLQAFRLYLQFKMFIRRKPIRLRFKEWIFFLVHWVFIPPGRIQGERREVQKTVQSH
jgi:hypothetical protein